ncbi:hypothetical protein D3C71_2020220 [compost metagenome]
MDAIDDVSNLLHRVLSTSGEVAHFVGHDRETTSAFAHSCSFDCCIEGEEVGLFCNAANDFQHRPDL